MTLLLCLVLRLQESALPPEPPADAQKETLRLLKQVFKDDYARREPAQVRDFARKLLEQGVATKDDLPSRFVMIREARDLAVAAGDAETVHRACLALEQSFTVDGPALKLAALGRVAAGAKDAESLRSLVRAYLATAEDAVRADALEAASSAAVRAEAAAKSVQDAVLAGRASEFRREIASIKEDWLKAKSGEPEATGRHLCFIKGDWKKGLPLLAAEGKGALKELAAKDSAAPVESSAQAEVAEGWWDLAQKEKSSWRKARMVARSRHWIDRALGAATGLAKLKLERRLEEAEATQAGYVNLLRLIDLKKDVVGGAWTLAEGAYCSDATRFCRLEIPYRPPPEYDLHAVFTRLGGGNDVNLLLNRNGISFSLILGGGGGVIVALGNCRGHWIDSPANPSARKLEQRFVVGRSVKVLVEVRRDRIGVFLDERPALEWKTDYSELSQNGAWELRDDHTLGFGSYDSPTAFQKLTLIEVGGTGRKLR